MVIYMYIAPGQGQTTPEDIFFININLLSICIPPASLPPFNYILLFFPIQMHGQPMLALILNRSRSSQGHDLYKLCRAPLSDASCQVSKS